MIKQRIAEVLAPGGFEKLTFFQYVNRFLALPLIAAIRDWRAITEGAGYEHGASTVSSNDLDPAISVYTKYLGFQVEQEAKPNRSATIPPEER